MQVQRITTRAGLAALEAPWNALAGDMPLRSWDWLATWWKHYGAAGRRSADQHEEGSARQLLVLAVYGSNGSNGGVGRQPLLGLAPWYIDRTIVKGNIIRWLGSGEVCTDHGSLICRPDDRTQVAEAIADALAACDEWDRLDLEAVDADDAGIGALVAALEARDCLLSRRPTDSCWVLDLPSRWDEYLAALSKSHRKQLRQLERRVLETERVRWHRVGCRADLEAAWPVLVDLHQRRRRSLGEDGCFASSAFHDFHREVAQRMLARNQLRMSWLELDGAPAAAEYHLADGNTTYAYQGGVDPERLDEESGRLSTILCLRQAIEDGHQHFDFLRGDEPYKAHWRAAPRAAYDVRVIPNRRAARMRGQMVNLAGAFSDWVRPVLQQARR